MGVFAVDQVAPQHFFHDEDVLEDVPVGGLSFGVRGHTPKNVTSPVFDGPAAPVTVARASFRPTLQTSFRALGLE
jgi:hypothetical protein